MKETILQVIREYAPVALFAIMMFVDKFGFTSFLGDIRKTVDLSSLRSELAKAREDLATVYSELTKVREELAAATETISRIKGSKK